MVGEKSTSPSNLWEVDYITPNLWKCGIHNPPPPKQKENLWNGIYHTLNFLKPIKLPKVSLKNQSKSQKNHKVENPIVLDFKWENLHSEYIIWYALVYIFFF
jgi:hypothetical protein